MTLAPSQPWAVTLLDLPEGPPDPAAGAPVRRRRTAAAQAIHRLGNGWDADTDTNSSTDCCDHSLAELLDLRGCRK